MTTLTEPLHVSIMRASTKPEVVNLIAHIDALRKQLAAAEPNARRYRWLRCRINNHHHVTSWPAVDALDAAIDAALLEDKT